MLLSVSPASVVRTLLGGVWEGVQSLRETYRVVAPFSPLRVGHAFRGTEFERRITQHFGDTATFDYGAIKDELTFFMIDGSHTYEYAKSDTLKSLALVTSPSTLVWHDCNEWQPGVTKWLVEMIDSGYAVKRIKGTAVAYLETEPGNVTFQSSAT
jgi:hypothetical protein